MRRRILATVLGLVVPSSPAVQRPFDRYEPQQRPLGSPADEPHGSHVSNYLFAFLERTARLVDITYCVGPAGIGISEPFSCASRCADFPSLRLVQSWNTGVLDMTDSSGFMAIDDGLTSPEKGDIAHGPVILVAFRGTYSVTNTVIDLETKPQAYVLYPAPDGSGNDDGHDGNKTRDKCTNCTVHAGFLASWKRARAVVLPALRAARAQHPEHPVHLIGHSLGGAVAALAALELRLSMGWDDVLVTTFGEPKVGNHAFVRYLDAAFGLSRSDGDGRERQAYRRVTHVGDPVPDLPPSEWGYRTHAGEIFIAKPDLPPTSENLRLCEGDADESCLTGPAREMVLRLRPWELFFAHRDYFWRLGLCLPGGDPANWGRGRGSSELLHGHRHIQTAKADDEQDEMVEADEQDETVETSSVQSSLWD